MYSPTPDSLASVPSTIMKYDSSRFSTSSRSWKLAPLALEPGHGVSGKGGTAVGGRVMRMMREETPTLGRERVLRQEMM